MQDNAIGTGTGKYHNKQLFRARQNHASLIPVLGLMKAEEYYGSASHVPPAPFSGCLTLCHAVIIICIYLLDGLCL